MLTEQDAREVIGCTAYTDDGDKIGKIGQLFLDDDSGRPEFVTVNTGLFGTNETFIPVGEATFNGGRLTVPYTKDKIKDAPNVDADGGHLDHPEEQRLYEYYGLTYGSGDVDGRTSGDPTGNAEGERSGDVSGRMADVGTSWTAEGSAGTAGAQGGMTDAEGMSQGRAGTAGTRGREDDRTGVDPSDIRDSGHDTSGPDTDDAMTRSEERLEVGTASQEAGRARLRKYVTTENETHTVPVRKEKAVLETEPVTDGNRGEALDGPDISEEEHEVTLNEERVKVSKTTEPVERVRLGKETVTDEETVSEEVRKEHIEAEGDVDQRR
jgi:uncharacterized protein (TIGR02271 family)